MEESHQKVFIISKRLFYSVRKYNVHARIQSGGQGVRTPPPHEKSQSYMVFSNTGPDTL